MNQKTMKKMAGVLGFEPRDAEIKTRCLTAWRYPNRFLLEVETENSMAGVLGFEPRDAEIKTRCLTAWRYPNNYVDINEINGAGRGT